MSECKHEWKFQQDYSKPGSFRRFVCTKCGCWGYNHPPNHWDGYKEKPIRAYKGNRTEPDPSWRVNKRRFLNPEPPRPGERQYYEDQCPSRMEEAVLGASRFIDPGDC